MLEVASVVERLSFGQESFAGASILQLFIEVQLVVAAPPPNPPHLTQNLLRTPEVPEL